MEIYIAWWKIRYLYRHVCFSCWACHLFIINWNPWRNSELIRKVWSISFLFCFVHLCWRTMTEETAGSQKPVLCLSGRAPVTSAGTPSNNPAAYITSASFSESGLSAFYVLVCWVGAFSVLFCLIRVLGLFCLVWAPKLLSQSALSCFVSSERWPLLFF